MAPHNSLGAALAIGIMIAGSASSTAAWAAEADRVVANVNGTDITLGHVAMLREGLPAQYQSLPDEILFMGILDQLIQQTALAQAAEDLLTPRDATGLENERRAYIAAVALRKVVAGAVSEEALQTAYATRFAQAAPETEYDASHILVATEEEARALMAELAAGTDFESLARQHSTDPGSGPRGGALGWFGLGMMVKPFEDAVVGLEPGAISEPVQTQFGFHIVRLNETRIASVPTLDDVRADLAAELEQAAIAARIEELTASATISRYDEGIDPALIRDQTLFDN